MIRESLSASMRDRPFFSIVLSTFGRGRHIAPTIESVLAQSFGNFELIVVGDGCNDDTEATVRSFAAPDITWRNLPKNTGSQSFPNNEGIRVARGDWIAYIGHDDIWTRDHLAALVRTIAATDKIDFAISGCVYHGPPGSQVYQVTGLFDSPKAPFKHFFPPSSIAHRRDVTTRIGEWRGPYAVKLPVDADFMLRAARAKMVFVSTGELTVHKFAAGHRYLSYLRVASDEQKAMLSALNDGQHIDGNAIVDVARQTKQFMCMLLPRFSLFRKAGQFHDNNRKNKGLHRAELLPLRERVVIGVTNEPRALDWYTLKKNESLRWSGPNPRPKILVPFTGERARISIRTGQAPLDQVRLFVEDACTEFEVANDANGSRWLVAEIPLKADDYTVLILETPMFRPCDLGESQDRRLLGIDVGEMVVEPLA